MNGWIVAAGIGISASGTIVGALILIERYRLARRSLAEAFGRRDSGCPARHRKV